MGADEKHAATYHGGEYTLDSTYVRTVFGLKANTPTCSVNPEILWTERTKQFDRWLETVRAEAKAEALNEAAHALDSATINIEVLNGVPDLKQAWAFRNVERKSTIQSLRTLANQYKEQS